MALRPYARADLRHKDWFFLLARQSGFAGHRSPHLLRLVEPTLFGNKTKDVALATCFGSSVRSNRNEPSLGEAQIISSTNHIDRKSTNFRFAQRRTLTLSGLPAFHAEAQRRYSLEQAMQPKVHISKHVGLLWRFRRVRYLCRI